MTTPSAAAGAYASLARLADPSANLGRFDRREGSGPSFSQLLKSATGALVEAGRKSDAQTQAMAAGKGNVVDVVTAVAETEVAVEALVAVRDRMIAAYEEVNADADLAVCSVTLAPAKRGEGGERSEPGEGLLRFVDTLILLPLAPHVQPVGVVDRLDRIHG